MARYIAKNIVSAGLASRCTVALAYAIGKAEPVAVNVDTDGTGEYRDDVLEQAVQAVFDLTPVGMRHSLGLSQRFLYAILHLPGGLFQLHGTEFLHHCLSLFSGCFLALLRVDRLEHLDHQLHLGTRRD